MHSLVPTLAYLFFGQGDARHINPDKRKTSTCELSHESSILARADFIPSDAKYSKGKFRYFSTQVKRVQDG